MQKIIFLKLSNDNFQKNWNLDQSQYRFENSSDSIHQTNLITNITHFLLLKIDGHNSLKLRFYHFKNMYVTPDIYLMYFTIYLCINKWIKQYHKGCVCVLIFPILPNYSHFMSILAFIISLLKIILIGM